MWIHFQVFFEGEEGIVERGEKKVIEKKKTPAPMGILRKELVVAKKPVWKPCGTLHCESRESLAYMGGYDGCDCFVRIYLKQGQGWLVRNIAVTFRTKGNFGYLTPATTLNGTKLCMHPRSLTISCCKTRLRLHDLHKLDSLAGIEPTREICPSKFVERLSLKWH
jgi:hypothetical protein